jgi:GT2 family glycosyltransferase
MPRVSVVIPAYNAANYIHSTVASVLAQTYHDYELIVVDDGSTDATREVLQVFGQQLKYIYQKNQERSAARNTGIRAASGELIAFLDSDDLWHPEKLERQVVALDEYPTAVLTYCQAAYMNHLGEPVSRFGNWIDRNDEAETVLADRSRELFVGDVVCGGGSTPMVRRIIIDRVGFFDLNLTYPEDWDYWARLSRIGPFVYIPEPLVRYRVYGWTKVLRIEASESIVKQHLKIIARSATEWTGSAEECTRLRSKATAAIHLRAALANYQLGNCAQGGLQLMLAIEADPSLAERKRIIDLAVDRAHLIQIDSGSEQKAEAFIQTFFANLPKPIVRFATDNSKARAWLLINSAFEKFRLGDIISARTWLSKGISIAPSLLTNRGVCSLLIRVWLGKQPVVEDKSN